MKKKQSRFPASLLEKYPAITSDDEEIGDGNDFTKDYDQIVDDMLRSGLSKEEANYMATKMMGMTPEEFNKPEEEKEEKSELFDIISNKLREKYERGEIQ